MHNFLINIGRLIESNCKKNDLLYPPTKTKLEQQYCSGFSRVYPRIMQLSVKKNSGASGVKINRLKNGIAPIIIARTCNRLHNQLICIVTKERRKVFESGSSETSSI